MHVTQAVALFIASARALSMVDTLMILSPGLQPGITAVRLRLHQRPWGTGRRDAGRDRLGLHLGPQLEHDYLCTSTSQAGIILFLGQYYGLTTIYKGR
jgi:hypothetical protein